MADGLSFRDLQSTNGTLLNGRRTEEGLLDESSLLQVGEAKFKIAGTSTDYVKSDEFPAGLRLLSTMEIHWERSPSRLSENGARLFSFDGIARLVESFLVEEKMGQEWRMLCGFLKESLGFGTVRCYEWRSETLALKAETGAFPEERVSAEAAQGVASVPGIAAFVLEGNPPLSLVSLPVAYGDRRMIFMGVAPGGGDPVIRYQEILPTLYVYCKAVIHWAEELSTKEDALDQLKERVRNAEAGLSSDDDALEPIVGRSPALLKEIQTADQAAPTELTVLLTGSTGTGKELFARRIHRKSKRAAGPFVPINCASIPESLLESELFGVERGAFTGAEKSRAGFFEKAAGGTIFLDEVGDLPLSLQPKLLRVLEEKEFSPLGTTKTRRVDVRVIAATNQDILKAVSEGRFRQDLYYRLASALVRLPPLCDRGEDILMLANHFLHVANREFGRSVNGFEEEAVQILRRYQWPGNVRQLQAVVKQMVLGCAGPVITREMAQAAVQRQQGGHEAAGSPQDPTWNEAKEAFEREFLRRRVETKGTTVASLARELGMTRANLYVKLKKWGLRVER
jgi:DNA-binding NtrC family response regulator